MIFSDYIIRTPPKHPFFHGADAIWTAPTQILNMFVTLIVILRTVLIFQSFILVFL